MNKKKIFALLAISEIFIVILWITTFLYVKLVEDSVFTWHGHMWLQKIMIIAGYALLVNCVVPKKYKLTFFVAVTYVMTFCLLLSVLGISLIGTLAYTKAGPHMIAAYITILISFAAYTPKIYRRLT